MKNDAPYMDGWYAYFHGVVYDKNPYLYDNARHYSSTQWGLGWLDAERHNFMKNEDNDLPPTPPGSQTTNAVNPFRLSETSRGFARQTDDAAV